jgi:hypothetical protein
MSPRVAQISAIVGAPDIWLCQMVHCRNWLLRSITFPPLLRNERCRELAIASRGEVSTARALTVGLSMMQMALVRPHIQARAVPTGAHLSSAGKAGQPAYPRRLDVPWSSSSP